MAKATEPSHQGSIVDVHNQGWRAPVLVRHSIAEITRLGFGTDCDGGIFGVIDGSTFNCPPG